MFFVGIQVMNRRVADYPEVIAGGNMIEPCFFRPRRILHRGSPTTGRSKPGSGSP